jgi:hypothetical protein
VGKDPGAATQRALSRAIRAPLGTYGALKITYVTTLIEGRDQIVIVNAWTGATNGRQQMTVLEGLADNVSGIS